MADPGPLVAALEAEPATLLHGDYRLGNLAVMPDDSVVAYDWQFAGRGPGVMDLAWLGDNVGVFEFRGWAFDCYRDALVEALDGDLDVPRWDRALAIARLAHVLRIGCFPGYDAVADESIEWRPYLRAMIAHFNDTVRRGADLL
jgi:aminoglycoside phosphotransferase (APT) family kinase protein